MAINDYLERCTSLAILGGTFDPIHNGHLAIAEAVMHQFKTQKVLVIPAGKPPHKPDLPVTAGEQRYQMILRAICKLPGVDTTRIEIDRKEASYTINTIKALKQVCANLRSMYFVLGQDAFEVIDTWKDAAELLTLCQFVVVPRPGGSDNCLEQQVAKTAQKYKAKIHILSAPQLDISSTYIRKCIASDKPVSALIPPEVEDYIRQNGLYKAVKPMLSTEHFEWAKSRLQDTLTPKRFKHSLGVVIEAEKLALHYGASVNFARWAALLHDCTKEYGADKKHALCKEWGIEVDEIVEEHIDLAHGLLGAEVARRRFYVSEPEILQAIKFHILGHKDLTLLDKIILLADFIEPYREDYHPLEEMRALAYEDIDKAIALGLQVMRDIDAKRGKKLHHWSEDALQVLTGGTHGKQ